MQLPNYFLADLPPEATLSPAMLAEACQTLKHNRERYLFSRPTRAVVALLSEVASGWLAANNRFRSMALEQGPAQTGFSRETLAAGLDTFFRRLTPGNFEALLQQDLGAVDRLDRMAASDPEQKTERASIASTPELQTHIAAGNLPVPALMSLVLGLLTRSAQFVKCSRGSTLLPRLFAHSLYDADPKVGACIEVAEWPGGSEHLEQELYSQADCVTATGNDETLAAIGQRLPSSTRLLGYGHRVSFAYITGRVLHGLQLPKIVHRAVIDVTAWDQSGCLSPHVIYVQQGEGVTAEKFGELLADGLAAHESVQPRGQLSSAAAGEIASRRSIYELRAATGSETRMWQSRESTAWTVVYEADPRFQFSCLNRFIYVKGVADLNELMQSADPIRKKLSTVGVAAPEHETEQLATDLARWGAARICPLGRMQDPPLMWRHDGRPALADLVRWTDWES
jgi:Acyl-CoA reductase (LuxC)